MEFLIIIFLIILNGLFSMSEIALISVRKIRLENQSRRGDLRAREALRLANSPDRFLSTVQIGITLISILMGIYSGDKFTARVAELLGRWELLRPYSHSLAVVVVLLLITYLALVIGELVPKNIGMARPEAVARATAGPMNLLSRITFPFIWLLSASTGLLVRMLNIKPAENNVTEEEIKAMIDEGTSSGAIEESEQEIIERVFHLGDRNITSLMTHRTDVAWIDVHDPPEKYRESIRQSLHSVYPVCQGQIDELIGVLYTRDLYLAPADTSLEKLMKKPLFIPENNSAYQVLEKFKLGRTHFGIIVDEYGSFLGIITVRDILEALVGDMPEAGDVNYEIRQRKDGSFLVDAQIPFYDFLTYFDKEEWIGDEEQQEFDTLAGFILHHLEHIPQPGETVQWRGFKFEIIDMDGHRIDKILVAIQPAEEQAGGKGS